MRTKSDRFAPMYLVKVLGTQFYVASQKMVLCALYCVLIYILSEETTNFLYFRIIMRRRNREWSPLQMDMANPRKRKRKRRKAEKRLKIVVI